MAVAVVLAVIEPRDWRGWMGIEPTQDASTAPRKTVLKTAGSSCVTVRWRPPKSAAAHTQSIVVCSCPPMFFGLAVDLAIVEASGVVTLSQARDAMEAGSITTSASLRTEHLGTKRQKLSSDP